MSEDRVVPQKVELVVYRRIRVGAKASHRILDFPSVFRDVGLDGDVRHGSGEVSEFSEEFVTAGEGETRGDDGVDEGFVGL